MAQDSIKSRLLLKIKAIDPEMRNATALSLILHLGLLVLFIWGLPHFSSHKELQKNINVVEMLAVSDITNVKLKTPKLAKPKPSQKAPSAAAKPKPALAEPARKPPPKIKLKSKPIRKREVEPLPKSIAKKEPPQAAPEEKPEPAIEPDEPDNMVEDAFASVLKSVESMASDTPAPSKDENDFEQVEDFLATASQESYQPGIPLSLSEIDAVRQQIMRNWTVLGGAREANEMQVRLKLQVARDGSVTLVEIMDRDRYASNGFFRAMADSAVRAVNKSSPLKRLPPEKYEGAKGWNQMELTFDPSEMLY